MAHALRVFIRQQMDERVIDQATFTRTSGLSRSHVSKLLADDRDRLPQLPRRETLAGIAKAFSVSEQVVLAVAVEALGLGYEADAFHNELATASFDELLDALRQRGHQLREQATLQHERNAVVHNLGTTGSAERDAALVMQAEAARRGISTREWLDQQLGAVGEENQDEVHP